MILGSRHYSILVANLLQIPKKIYSKNFLLIMKDKNLFFNNVLITFCSQIILLFFSIITGAIVARCLGPDGKGILALTITFTGILKIILNFGIGSANVYFASNKKIDISILVSNSIIYSIITSGIGIMSISILIIFGTLKKIIPGVPNWALFLSLILFPVSMLSSYLSNILQGLNKIMIYNIISIIQGVILLISILLLVYVINIGLIGAIIGYIISSIISLIILIIIFKKTWNFKRKTNLSIMNLTLSYGIKGHIGNVLQFFNYRIDLYLVNYFLEAKDVGIYSVSVALAELLWNLPNAVGFVIFPKAASTSIEIMNKFTPRIFRITIILTTLGALFLTIFGKLLIEIIYSTDFISSYDPMLALLPGVVLLGGAKVLTNEIAGRGYPQYNSINSAFALIISILLNLILIPKYGVLGAAIASSIAYTIILLIAIWCYKQCQKTTGF